MYRTPCLGIWLDTFEENGLPHAGQTSFLNTFEIAKKGTQNSITTSFTKTSCLSKRVFLKTCFPTTHLARVFSELFVSKLVFLKTCVSQNYVYQHLFIKKHVFPQNLFLKTCFPQILFSSKLVILKHSFHGLLKTNFSIKAGIWFHKSAGHPKIKKQRAKAKFVLKNMCAACN